MVGYQTFAIFGTVNELSPWETVVVAVGHPFGPVIDGVDPATTAPGERVSITGAGFGGAADALEVKIGGARANIVSLSDEDDKGLRTLVVEVPDTVRRGVDLFVSVDREGRSSVSASKVTVSNTPLIRTSASVITPSKTSRT